MEEGKKWGVILADPPWDYEDDLVGEDIRGGAAGEYECVTIEGLCDLPVGEVLGKKDCALFLWCTGPMIQEGLDVIDAWGFEYKTLAFVWQKTCKTVFRCEHGCPKPKMGLGRWTRGENELVLLGAKGKPQRVDKGVRETITAPAMGHSIKPNECHRKIERLMGEGTEQLELFARRRERGWQATGLEYDGFDISELRT